MNKVTITITDVDGALNLVGEIEDKDAINKPPTPALIVGSYLAANVERVIKDSMAWFTGSVVAPADQEIQSATPSIIIPDQGLTQ